jgi:sec-independent protein translocase protein TatB
MFGIGLPEMILIMALALIVVGPDKLPELARSLAKGLTELKKTAEGIKEQLSEDGNPLDDIKPDLEQAAKSLKDNLLEPPEQFDAVTSVPAKGDSQDANPAEDAYRDLLQHTTNRQDISQTDEADNTATVQDVPALDEVKPAPEKHQDQG